MTKADLIEKVQASRPDLSKRQVADVVDAVFDQLSRAIRKDKRFSMPGFGTFVVKRRAGRVGRNPKTGAAIENRPHEDRGLQTRSRAEEGTVGSSPTVPPCAHRGVSHARGPVLPCTFH